MEKEETLAAIEALKKYLKEHLKITIDGGLEHIRVRIFLDEEMISEDIRYR
jgi:pentose-5-phosphate-3-epimerase